MKKNPAVEVSELVLFADNESGLANQKNSIIQNLQRRMNKGQYDPEKAAKLWGYLIDNAVKEYNVQFGNGKSTLRQPFFTMADRKAAAKQLEKIWRDELEIQRMNNPKRRKNPGSAGVRGKGMNIYEIYTKNPQTGEGGWNIFFVQSTPENIKSFPNFDEIITVNDYPMVGPGSTMIYTWDGKRIVDKWYPKGGGPRRNPAKKAKRKAKRKANPRLATGRNVKKTRQRKTLGVGNFMVFRVDTIKFDWLGGFTATGFKWQGSKIGALLLPKNKAFDLARFAEQKERGAFTYGAADAGMSRDEILKELMGKQ